MAEPGRRRTFNAARAQQLVNAGFTYREVGILMADEERRIVPYTINTVGKALAELRKAKA